ncbi:hypothetical protein D3C74_475970 [compost metagenome]
MTSGISARDTTSPASSSVLSSRGDLRVRHTDWRCIGVSSAIAVLTGTPFKKVPRDKLERGPIYGIAPGAGGG